MGENTLISVIIPTLNEEKLIKQTLSQFTPEIKKKFKLEVIISDGGSSDSTLRLLDTTVDKLVEANPNEPQNIPRGRNAGAKSANGTFYYFFNADTLIKEIEKFFETTLTEFENTQNLALACRIHVFPDEVRFSDKIFHGFYNNYVRILNFLRMGMGRGECHMVRMEIFWKVNGYNESLAAGEDYDLYRRIGKLGRIKFLGGLTVYESPRRYRKFGYRRVFGDWTRNSLSVLFKNKSVSKVWEAVR
ncbi:MAG: glycosyltransferase [Chlorobi bacterium]|nr:glycosyltransferase [Chlorobiota bacterium]MCI0717165.1 glycosyltransferase [Chlorobiota bacterium]